MEIWKAIEDYPNYEVSNYGNVRSLPRHSYTRDYGNIMKAKSKTSDGYLRVTLFNEKGRKIFFIHRLVLNAFKPNPNPELYTQINHIDECRDNNFVDNLEWCTAQYNSAYGTRPSKISDYQINRSKRRKTVYQILDDEIVNVFKSARAASRELGFSQGHISACCRGEQPTYNGYKWCYSPNSV